MSYPARPKWDPLGQLQSLRSDLSRRLGGAFAGTGGRLTAGSGAGMLPEVEVDRDDEVCTVTARLPGVAPEEVAVEVDSQELRIRTRSVAETEQVTGVPQGEPGGPALRDSALRSFDYRLSLGGDVDLERVDATMDHGLLTVRLPRTARGERRQITIGRRAI